MEWSTCEFLEDLNRFKLREAPRGSLERLRALQSVSELAVAVAGVVAVVVVVLMAVIQPLVVAEMSTFDKLDQKVDIIISTFLSTFIKVDSHISSLASTFEKVDAKDDNINVDF